LGVYFARVGWDQADKAASVVAALIAVAGFAMTLYSLNASSGGGRRVSQRAEASGRGRVTQVAGGLNAAAEGGTAAGQVVQRATVSDDAEVTQVGGDQGPPAQR
ncbi:hypothetical protein, partial [Nonomuraea aridisoli]|uniref:hypothetical protein n=1 Tax=Nonomuraea aridisoli TaxID=2070368 RepID=UPI0015E8BE36